jgi:hypothetical protein
MTRSKLFRSFRRISFFLSVPLLLPFVAPSQITLTGAIQFSTNSSGAFSENQSWNTFGGDQAWDLWVARNPDGSEPINGPSDDQAGINIPMVAGNSYRFYIFGAPQLGISLNGLNLFINGGDSTPAISVFGPTNSSLFTTNSSSNTRTLNGGVVPGSDTSYSVSNGVIAVLTNYSWYSPATPPGDVCQPFTFTPGGGASFFGSFTVRVFPAASLSVGQPTGSPASELTFTGSGFLPGETVGIYPNRVGSSPIDFAVAGSDGTFAKTVLEPQHAYGTLELFALGLSSGDLGATKISVTAGVAASPKSVEPGGTVAAEGLGFGAGETVSLYLDNPRELIGTATANALGSFVGGTALTVTIPADASTGLNALVAIGSTTGAIGIGKLIVK